MKTHKRSRAALTRREMLYLGAGGAAGCMKKVWLDKA